MQPDQQPDPDQWHQPQGVSSEPHAYQGPATATSTARDQDPAAVEPETKQPLDGEEEAVRWQAAEFIYRPKGSQWYAIFGVVIVVMIAVALFLLNSWDFAVLIVVMAAAIVVIYHRPPGLHSYTLSRKGLHVDDRLYAYGEFKEFGLVADDDENSIMLVPRKRFRPGVTVYFPEEAGEAIVDMLASRLPMKQIKLDPIDRLVRLLRI